MTDAFDKDVATRIPKTKRESERPKRPWDVKLPADEEPEETIDPQSMVLKTIDPETIVSESTPKEEAEILDPRFKFYDAKFNFISDNILPLLTPEEQVVFIRIYRLSHGLRQETTDFVGYTKLAEKCNISLKTTYRVIKKLVEEKRYLKVVEHHGNKGTRYKLNLLTMDFETIVRDLGDHSQTVHSTMDSQTTIIKDLLKSSTNSTRAHASDDLISTFYLHLGHGKISKAERKRATEVYDSLGKEGFTDDEISFAIEWTLRNVKDARSFAIIERTIGQALSEREKILEQQSLEEKREKERQAELEKRRREEEENARLDEYIAKLSPAEKEALESQARDELIRKEQIKERFINSMVLTAKIKEIVKKERF